MFFYQVQLAWRSIKKNPIMCGIMIVSLAFGITATMIGYTTNYATNQNYLQYKDDRLFILQTDSWDLKQPYQGMPMNQMPDTLSYRDVTALLKSDIPEHKTAMVQWGGTVAAINSDAKPFVARTRISTRDYFSMFDETFLYGSSWSASADNTLQNVVVLTEETNKRLFNGENSVGKSILFERNIYQIVGVLKENKNKTTSVEDLDLGMRYPESQLFFPFGIIAERELKPWRSVQCPADLHDYGTGYKAMLQGSCLWLTFWVEFSSTEKKHQFEDFVTHYIESQKEQGFYPRPLRFALSNISEKLVINRYKSGFSSLLEIIGFGFLTVCSINCIAMLLAKFFRNTSEIGIRRALGASRAAIFIQHFLETALIGILGGLLGLALTYLGLALLKRGFSQSPSADGMSSPDIGGLFTLNIHLMAVTLLIGFFASTLAGLYPVWQICKTPTAKALKIQ